MAAVAATDNMSELKPNEAATRGGSCAPAPCSAFAARSLTLQKILRDAGYVKGSGVATAGIRLVSKLAKAHKLRDWPHTLTLQDYDALLHVTREHLSQYMLPDAGCWGR